MECVGFFTCTWSWLDENVAAVIATCAMAATVWQGYLARKHNKLSVKPLLDVRRVCSHNTGEFSYTLCNHGLGPAIITSLSLKINNVEYSKVTTEALASVLSLHFEQSITHPEKLYFSRYKHLSSSPIKSGSSIPILKISIADIEEGDFNPILIIDDLDKISFSVSYKSIYEEEQPQCTYN